jgi:hypothetical protein
MKEESWYLYGRPIVTGVCFKPQSNNTSIIQNNVKISIINYIFMENRPNAVSLTFTEFCILLG